MSGADKEFSTAPLLLGAWVTVSRPISRIL
jgi:hypothetical protein